MERFLKIRAVEVVDHTRSVHTHARVSSEKDKGVLRYMSTSSVASNEAAVAATAAVAEKNKVRKQAAELIAATGCSQAVAAKHLSTNYANVTGSSSSRGRFILFSGYRIRRRVTRLLGHRFRVAVNYGREGPV